MQAGPGGAPLVDRDATLVAGSRALSAAQAGRGQVLVVSGPAGIGKSAVLAALVEQASSGGMRVLRARGSHVEADFAFGVVRQLADPALRQAPPAGGLLQGIPATALAALGVPGAAAEPVHDLLPTVLQGLHRLVSSLATTRPLALVVDDVHWSDAPSLMFVEYLARRIGDSPVAVVLGLRMPDQDGEQAQAAVARMVAAGDAVQSCLTGLSPGAAAVLAERRLGRRPDEQFVTACHAATGGNPFLLCALLDDVARTGAAPSGQVAATLHTLAPEAVCRDVLVRLHRLPQELRAVAQAVAVLGGNASVRAAAAVAGHTGPATDEAADALAVAGLLSAGRPLDFVHPLLRQAVYSDLPAGRRSRLHRDAARELVRVGAAPARAASHLLQVEPGDEEWACSVLRRAAADASGAGLPATAVLYLQRALDEAPAAAERGPILLELGLAQAHAALPACTETLAAALTEGVAAERRAEVSLALARALWYLAGDAVGALGVLDAVDAASLDPDMGMRVVAQRVELRVGWVDGLGGLGAAEQARAAAELEVLAPSARPPRPESAVVLGTLARRALEQGEPSETAAALARDAVEAGPESLLYSSGPDVLVWAEDYTTAALVLDDLLDEAARSGSAYAFGVGSLWRGVLGFRLGRLVAAEADCRACVDLMTDLGVQGLSYPTAFLAEVLLERDVDAAAAVLAGVPTSRGGFSEFYLHARGRLRAAQGRLDEAVEDLTAAGARATSPAILPWRSSAARVLAQAGQRAAAVELARDEVALTSRQGGRRAQAVALAALGRALGPGEGLPVLEASLAALNDSPAALVRAGVLADLGRFHRLARRIPQAREALRAGLDLADACGARLLADEIRSELVASGARPRRAATTGVAALTASERRVAELAATGKSNRDIAHALFVSPWTVASHLTRVYQKLGVPGREQIGEVLDAPAHHTGSPVARARRAVDR